MREYRRHAMVSWQVIRGIVLFWAVMCLGAPAMAVDYYLDVANGNNDYPGTSSDQAFQTLAHALDILNSLNLAADTAVLYVAGGTYSVALEGDASHLIANSNITIKGAGSATTIVDGSLGDVWSNGIEISDSSSNITITGLRFTGFGGAGIRINACDNVKILDCSLDLNGNGIAMENALITGSTVLIMGNLISGNTMNAIDILNSSGYTLTPAIKGNAITASVYNAVNISCMSGAVDGEVMLNEISTAGIYGIYLYGDLGDVTTAIASNIIENCPTGIYVSGYNGTVAPDIKNNLITNAADGGYGIYLSEGMTGGVNPEIYFNTIDGGGLSTTGIYIYGFGSFINPVIRYNCVTNFGFSGIEQDANLSAALDIDYNNAYGCQANYSANLTVGNNIQVDPIYEADFSIPVTSPCVDALSAAVVGTGIGDDDIMGTSRPRASSATASEDYDIGCYEYPYQQYDFTMPTGTGLSTDYRLMTFPMPLDGVFSTAFQNAFGAYDTEIYRVFMYDTKLVPPDYRELSDVDFDLAFSDWQGRGFWVISRSASLMTQTHTFEGSLTGNRIPFKVSLDQGWNLIGLPWPSSTANPDNIALENIVVDDDAGSYRLTGLDNSTTYPGVWDYTETGYDLLSSATDVMAPGKAYWIYVYSTTATVLFPPDNVDTYFSLKKKATPGPRKATKAAGMAPPPPPGQYLEAEGEKGCFIQTLFSEM